MTSPGGNVTVDPGVLHRTAGGWRADATDFVSDDPPDVDDDWDGVRDFHGHVHRTNRRAHKRLNDNSDAIDGAAQLYKQADQPQGPAISTVRDAAGIFTGVAKDISAAVTGVLTPTLSASASAAGALGGAAASGAAALANAGVQMVGTGMTTHSKLAADVAEHGIPGLSIGGGASGTRTGGKENRIRTVAASQPSAPPAGPSPAGAALPPGYAITEMQDRNDAAVTPTGIALPGGGAAGMPAARVQSAKVVPIAKLLQDDEDEGPRFTRAEADPPTEKDDDVRDDTRVG